MGYMTLQQSQWLKLVFVPRRIRISGVMQVTHSIKLITIKLHITNHYAYPSYAFNSFGLLNYAQFYMIFLSFYHFICFCFLLVFRYENCNSRIIYRLAIGMTIEQFVGKLENYILCLIRNLERRKRNVQQQTT